jgi:tetratricopeptide (TPR) repeat protein
MIACHLHRRDQLERLVTVLLMTSFGVSVFALVQRAGFDPRHLELKGGRVISTVGHPIYLGGYLLMVIPLCIWRVLILAGGLRRSGRSTGAYWAGLALYGLVLIAQMLAFLCAGSRGPLLGLAAGLLFFVLIVAVITRRRWILVLGSGVVATAFVALVLLGIANNPSRHWASLPWPQSVVRIFSPGHGNAAYRLGYWTDAIQLLRAKDPVPFPLGGQDVHHAFRLWMGYGAETVDCVVPHFHLRLDSTIENRLHNLFWDQLVSSGLLGVAALQIFLSAAFYHGFRALGLIRSRSVTLGFFATVTASTVAGAVGFALVLAPPFAGLGWFTGFVAGAAFFALGSSFTQPPAAPQSKESWHWLFLAALLAALAGHLVDMSLAFWTVSTALLLCVYCGLLVVFCKGGVGTMAGEAAVPATFLNEFKSVADPGAPARSRPSIPALSTITSLAVVALLASTIHAYFQRPFSISQVLAASFLRLEGLRSLLFLPLLLLWVGFSFALAVDSALQSRRNGFGRPFAWGLGLSGTLGCAYALFKCTQIVAIGTLPTTNSSAWEVETQAGSYERLHVAAVVVLLLLTLALGWFSTEDAPRSAWTSRIGVVVGAAVLLVVPLVAWELGVGPLRGPFQGQWGVALQRFLRLPAQAAEVYRQGIALDANNSEVRVRLGRLLTNQAQSAPNREKARELFSEAESVLLQTLKPTELNRGPFWLGELYLARGLAETGPLRSELARKALDAFTEACVYEPKNEEIWTSSSLVSALLVQDRAAAESKKRRARELAAAHLDYWGEFYAVKAAEASNAELATNYGALACEYYDGLVQGTNAIPGVAARVYFQKGKLLLALGNLPEAITNLREAERNSSHDDIWKIEAVLAETYLRETNISEAEEHLQRALSNAPPAEKTALLLRFQAVGRHLTRPRAGERD